MELGREIIEFARMELLRTLVSAKGLVLLALYGLIQVAGGLFFLLAYSKPAGVIAWQAMVGVMASGHPQAQGAMLVTIPPPMLFGYWFTQLVLPALVLITGYDQLANELGTRSVRYVAFRSRRASWALGKALALEVLVAVMTAASGVVVLGFSFFSPGVHLGAALGWSVQLWLLSCVASLAYVGLVTLISACYRTPFLALATGAVVLFGAWVLSALSHFGSLQWIAYLLPGTYVEQLLSTEASSTLAAALICAGIGGAFLAGAVGVLRARDL